MACHGGFSLDEQTRCSWYNPEAVLEDLKEGMTFVDVGCGDGFFSLIAARKVGAEGKVYAVDIDASRVEKLQNKAAEQGLTNIEAMVGRAEDAVFCRGCADFVLYSMDLHDFDEPQKVLENARVMLKASGVLVDLDWKKMQMEFGPPERIRFSEARVAEMLELADFRVASTKDAGPYHYLITAKPK
ncbi:MAG: class I SAM-dependent methyltransferase [Candidatus Bathyarchaeota archaeon]|nr:class I SAM-dependent methyltransferase [Candidatus Bathyarchaeota archaeon]